MSIFLEPLSRLNLEINVSYIFQLTQLTLLYISQLTHRDKVSVDVNDHRSTNQIEREAVSGPYHEWGHCSGGQAQV